MSSEPQFLLGDLFFPEGPRFRDGRLWFSDMHGHEVVAVSMDGAREQIVQVPTQPSGLGWLGDGTLLVVSMSDRKLMKLAGDELVVHADLSAIATWHCNDMVVDGTGRAYVGNFGFDLYSGADPTSAKLALVTPDGTARAVASDLMFPNGTVVTPDNKTLIVGETFGMRLTAFDIETDGSLSNRRVWADLPSPPDGICLDAEGCVWVAVPLNPGAFLRVAEGGEIKRRIDVPDHGAYACMLGGDDEPVLFMLEAAQGLPVNMKRGDGRIRTLRVDVPGAGWP